MLHCIALVVGIRPLQRPVASLLIEQGHLGVELRGNADAVASALGRGQHQALDRQQSWVDIGRRHPPWLIARSSAMVCALTAASSAGSIRSFKAHELFAQPRAHFRFVVRGKIKIIGRTWPRTGGRSIRRGRSLASANVSGESANIAQTSATGVEGWRSMGILQQKAQNRIASISAAGLVCYFIASAPNFIQERPLCA